MNALNTLEAVAAFLLDHADLIELIAEAIKNGAKKADIVEAIKQSMVAASDLQMETEGVT